MRVINRKLALCIPIRDPAYQYPADFQEVLLSKVKEIYEGNCFRACKILKIIGIATDVSGNKIYTMPEFDNMRRDNTATSTVTVDATVLVLGEYDIIHNCKVVNINSKSILCNWEHGSVNMMFHKNLQTLKKGQIIPVRVGNWRCTYTKSKIPVNAIQFIPIKPRQPTYQTDEPSPADITYAKQLITGAKEYISKIAMDGKFKLFADMLSFSTTEEKSTSLDIESFIQTGDSFIGTRAYVKNPSQLEIRVFTTTPNTYIQCKWIVAISSMIDDCISFVDDCNNLAITYSTTEKYNDAKNIWSIYNGAKQSIMGPKVLSKLTTADVK